MVSAWRWLHRPLGLGTIALACWLSGLLCGWVIGKAKPQYTVTIDWEDVKAWALKHPVPNEGVS